MLIMSTTQRSKAASYRTAKHRMGTTWNKVQGFLSRRIVWNGPASECTMSNFVTLVVPPPWSLPPEFLASWQQYHNGEWEKSAGMYLGARLLSIEEIALVVRRWKNDEEGLYATQHDEEIKRNTTIFRIPLFAEHRSRQIAMELIVTTESNITNTNIRSDTMLCHHYHHHQQQQQHHGRIVLISPLAPFGPHYKVLANSWEGFLTLI